MQSTTFGDSKAAILLMKIIIEEIPEKRRAKTLASVSRILHHYYDTVSILSRSLQHHPETAWTAIKLFRDDTVRRVQDSKSGYLTPLIRDLMCNLITAKTRFYHRLATWRSIRAKEARPKATIATHFREHHIVLLDKTEERPWKGATPITGFACLICGKQLIERSLDWRLFHCESCKNTWEVVPKEWETPEGTHEIELPPYPKKPGSSPKEE